MALLSQASGLWCKMHREGDDDDAYTMMMHILMSRVYKVVTEIMIMLLLHLRATMMMMVVMIMLLLHKY